MKNCVRKQSVVAISLVAIFLSGFFSPVNLWALRSPFRLPSGLDENVSNFSSSFGEYRSSNYIHAGVDMGRASGTSVYAVEEGTVWEIDTDAGQDSWVKLAGPSGHTTFLHVRDFFEIIYQDKTRTISPGQALGTLFNSQVALWG